jgi:hypothetical protein
LTQEQGAEQENRSLSLNMLLADTLASLEQKRVDFPSLIAVLSLFNLFSVLNNPVQPPVSKTGPAGMGGAADLLGMLAGMLGGGVPGADLSDGLAKQGKNMNPQMLLSLLSLLSQAKSSTPALGQTPNDQAAPPERRTGRGFER